MTPERVTALVATVAIIAAMGAGLWLVGSPVDARSERFDRARVSDLQQIMNHLNRGIHAGWEMPATLDEARNVGDIRAYLNDPRTGEAYLYERLGPRSYRLCATFETEGPHGTGIFPRAVAIQDEWNVMASPNQLEGAGENCFTVTSSEGNGGA